MAEKEPGLEAVNILLETSTNALKNAELCFREKRFDATVREATLAIENAANAFILSLGGTYVSSHYEYRRTIETMAQRRWKALLRRPGFKAMLEAADLPRSSVAYRYPIAVVEGKIQIRKPPNKGEAEELLTSAQAFLKNTRKYIEEYKERASIE